MQPYFFPYLGYFSLIKHTDKFILLDMVQFIRHGWIERNRILKHDGYWLYIKVPLIKTGRDVLIKDCLIDNGQNWKNRILSQMLTYKRIAPYYKGVIQLLEELLSNRYQSITDLNMNALQAVCNYLSIECNMTVFSEMMLEIDVPKHPDEWALNICKAIGGVHEYWNPPGGVEIFDAAKYRQERIKLVFQKINIQSYNQKLGPFLPSLSILDVMMFNSPRDVNRMLDNYQLI